MACCSKPDPQPEVIVCDEKTVIVAVPEKKSACCTTEITYTTPEFEEIHTTVNTCDGTVTPGPEDRSKGCCCTKTK